MLYFVVLLSCGCPCFASPPCGGPWSGLGITWSYSRVFSNIDVWILVKLFIFNLVGEQKKVFTSQLQNECGG